MPITIAFIATVAISGLVAAFGAAFTYFRKNKEDPETAFHKASFYATLIVGLVIGVIAAFKGIEINLSETTLTYVAAQLLIFQGSIGYVENGVRIVFAWLDVRYPALPDIE